MEKSQSQLFCGFLGRDPYLAYTAIKLEPVCELSLGVRLENNIIEWKKIVVFGKLAELCKIHLRKGNEVFVQGRIKRRVFKDKIGNEKTISEILASSVGIELLKI